MTNRSSLPSSVPSGAGIRKVAAGLILFTAVVVWTRTAVAEQLKSETAAAFEHYVQLSEQRMATELTSGPFLRLDAIRPQERDASSERLKKGEVITERLQTLDGSQPVLVPGGLIHHWMGTVFIPGATLEQTLAFLQDYDNQYKFYGPEVQQSKLIRRNGTDFQIFLRLKKTKVVTVILDANYDVKYTLFAPDRATSDSYSTRIAEVENPGKPDESEKPVGNDSGFLWRLNSYWRFLQRDGGVYVQLEAISLTRNIPTGLGWLISPFITSIPKESLVFTLTRTRHALRREGTAASR
jgi:hypothetical protein